MRHLLNSYQHTAIAEAEADGYRIIEITPIPSYHIKKGQYIVVLVKVINEQQFEVTEVHAYPGATYKSSYTTTQRAFNKMMNFIKLVDEIGEEQAFILNSI